MISPIPRFTEPAEPVDYDALPISRSDGRAPRERKQPQPRKRLPRRNDERHASRLAEAFGPHADLIRRLPCCACRPHLYRTPDDARDTVLANGLIPGDASDPHHWRTRGSRIGKAKHLVPLCGKHHDDCDRPWSTQADVEREAGVCFRDVAARLWAVGCLLRRDEYVAAYRDLA